MSLGLAHLDNCRARPGRAVNGGPGLGCFLAMMEITY